MRPAAVVFDLDGTLVDSRHDLAAAVNATRRALGRPPLPVAAVEGMVGEGASRLLQQALPAALDEGSFEAALALFLDLYYEGCLVQTRTYPGIVACLTSLARRYPLAILTNKPERHTRRILAGLALAPFFDAAIGGDTLSSHKPDPAGLLLLAQRWGCAPERLLLVGDSAVDARTARAAGAALALVPWGYGQAQDLAGVAAWRPATAGELAAGLE